MGVLTLMGGCASGQPAQPQAVQPDADRSSALGSYLAGRHAERIRDYSAATRVLSEALDREP